MPEAEKAFDGCNYGEFKSRVADAVMDEIKPFQERFYAFRSNEPNLDKIFEQGAAEAKKVATVVLDRVKKAVGLK